MRLLLILFTFSFSLFALSDNYKVVLERFNSKRDARQAYETYQNNPTSAVSQYAHTKEFIIQYRKSGDGYIIAAEPFNKREDAELFLQTVHKNHPKATVSRGVADDYLFLLAQHNKELTQQPTKVQPSNKNHPAALTIASTLTPEKIPAVSHGHSTTIPLSIWILLGSIVSLGAGWIGWREKTFRHLQSEYTQLREKKEALQQSIQAKNDFIAMMSHEVRAPINAITGISHLVLESRLTVTQRTQITKLKDSAHVLLSLINDILDHSKIEAGKVSIEQIPFDLNTLLDDISNIVAHKAQEKGIEVIFDIDQSVPHKLIGDPLRLLQVLVNLLNNAVKFTEQGSVILRARGQQISRVNLKINFEVIDTGIGIDEHEVKNLFTPYTQADDTISRKYGGSGLGLSICKNLVSLMGGSIYVHSILGKGSTFSFDIKLHSDFEYEKRRYRLPSTDLMNKNALIVDPNPDNISVLQRGLEYYHYEVKTLPDASELLASMKYYSIDILFLDSKITLNPVIKKELQEQIKNDTLKLVWIGEDTKKQREFVLQKPYNQQALFKIILSVYGYATNEEKHLDNTKKLKEGLKRFAGRSLLLAEDNEINRSIISGLLSGTSINIITAKTGKEAVEIVEMNPDICVILMDIQMPIMDGYEAAQIIRKEPEKDFIPIIAITGNTLEGEIEKISQAGMNGHIAKPIDVNVFYTTLYHAFEKSRNQIKKPITPFASPKETLDTITV
ncbi:MAG: ATP-binding protein [Sulfuricurvum sp.]|uniref:ATP-binding protein n=1 Tax=Sulfuricurvum sp. TaxID=2025608 RepID=UPI00262ECD2D|nr:ATP-binding protein [Sulfuricurvum sp.]MDD2828588.1 ATP-binding protein [Sulfuricurvum sp.]MDD4948265.1 ATP-binding protein [Sulfuricurvum sp.]